jgi:hypothetical protein
MKRLKFNCHLLTDIIITAEASTEEYKKSLDYIPGSKFLGIVAKKLYDVHNADKTRSLFHNGAVRYGDARPIIGDTLSHKIPFSWFHLKGQPLTDKVFIHHLLKPETLALLRQNKMQLKQVRSGYFSAESHEYDDLDQEFSLKSAYDEEKRRSKDGQMYGYFSLPGSTLWQFTVDVDKDDLAEEVKGALIGQHQIGRSRSAEYGLVQIDFLKEEAVPGSKKLNEGEVVLYAASNWCFYNEYGQTTTLPTAQQLLGNDSTVKASVLWEKSQVRTRNYQIWNFRRHSKDADRHIIERGSVFVIKLETGVELDIESTKIGAHRNEGFGEVLINPPFLSSENETLIFELKKGEFARRKTYIIEKSDKDNFVIDVLKERLKTQSIDNVVNKLVNDFVARYSKDFRGLSKSQWGTIRNFAKNANTIDNFKEYVFKDDVGFVYRGQSEHEWRKNGRRDKLKKFLEENEDHFPELAIKLSNQMAKNA